ncbi:SDR family NAD(P)-dependent oxidoreductase [Gordonia shandongensis]|uniref:SDR family NAD(P)-dependent oxidoreductase n=1 Tax=Gordonia shandongensis TaxID=376351 RepID=UPI0004212F95|nr:SDR family NAD(P)-dependent oxidoreductase [Gordonia shandongensis]
MTTKSLDGRIAIVTGAGRGIGAAIARSFAAQGAKVVINDLGGAADGSGSDDGPARSVAEEITAAGGVALADGGDIADTATGERLVRTAVEQFGGLDVVVNVAGILRDRMIFNLAEEDWDAVIRVHLRGHFSLIKPAAAYWRSQRNPAGQYRIINFTSDSAIWGSPGQPNYAAAKRGVIGLTASLANGLARYGVTANAIAPAAATRLIATVPKDRSLDASSDGPKVFSDESSPENIAPICSYLAGTQSGWLSGRTIGANGYGVTLFNTPEILAEVRSDGPWTPDALAEQVEREFRPLADGLPPSIFSVQVPTSAN